MPKTRRKQRYDKIEAQAQALYHAQTRAWSGTAWAWTKASDEVKEKFREHARNGTHPPLPGEG